MTLLFLKQYASWFVFLLFMQVLLNLILIVDDGFQGVSIFYFNLIWLVGSALFLLLRYIKDSALLKGSDLNGENYIQVVKESYNEKLEMTKVELQQQKLALLNQQDELLAWVHEMKAPLTSSQLLLEQLEHSELKSRLEGEWLRLFLLLDQQLHSTRLMTIEQDNRMEKFNLEDIVIQEIKALKSWCFDKKIAIDLQVVDIEVTSDRKWLAFILRQILSNAVKYSHIGGEIKIYMTTHQLHTSFTIEDFGIGIKAKDLPRVFRKSYTGTSGRETTAATGMGLYLAKQAASSLKIDLTIESNEGEGTKVNIILPKSNEYIQTLS